MTLAILKRTTWAGLAFAAAMMVSIVPATNGGASISIGVQDVQARVGRPLTPVSVAGVARRTTRRTVRRGAIAAGAAATAVHCGYAPYPACH